MNAPERPATVPARDPVRPLRYLWRLPLLLLHLFISLPITLLTINAIGERIRLKSGECLEHRTLFLLRMGAVAEVAARRQRFNLGKSLLRSFTGNPDMELSPARCITDHATLWEENHLAP